MRPDSVGNTNTTRYLYTQMNKRHPSVFNPAKSLRFGCIAKTQIARQEPEIIAHRAPRESPQ